MGTRALTILLLTQMLPGQSPVDHKKVVDRLGAEADAFERTAYRIAGIEVLKQTVPNGVRITRSLRGTYVKLPGYTREIESEYGFVSMDVRGGSLKEARRVLKIDGQKWNGQSKSLRSLAKDITSNDDKSRQHSLERFEEYGLNGFVTDLGQLILLFARGGASKYEIQFEKTEEDGSLAYTYQQLDGGETVTVYGETKEPVRQKIHGRVWVQQNTALPLKISFESQREYDQVPVTDRSTVEYTPSKFGTLLPLRIVHQQFSGTTLMVTDEFYYSGFRQVLPSGRR